MGNMITMGSIMNRIARAERYMSTINHMILSSDAASTTGKSVISCIAPVHDGMGNFGCLRNILAHSTWSKVWYEDEFLTDPLMLTLNGDLNVTGHTGEVGRWNIYVVKSGLTEEWIAVPGWAF